MDPIRSRIVDVVQCGMCGLKKRGFFAPLVGERSVGTYLLGVVGRGTSGTCTLYYVEDSYYFLHCYVWRRFFL